MTTARDLITSALRKIQVLGNGSTLDPTEADQALETLNSLLSSFSAEGAITFEETLESFTLTNNKASYTIGAGEDFSTTAPLYITAAYVRQGDTDYPVTSFDEQEYSRISQKDISGSVPRIYYYDTNFPVATIYFYPVPSSSDTFFMHSRKALTSFTTLDTVFNMPEQYKAMLIHNLAVWIAPEYEREASPTIKKLAAKTKKTVLVQNERNEKHAALMTGIPARGQTSQYSDQNIFGGYYT
jgi:hypothetical protein